MSYSRRQLEALGEPFGDSATQVIGGRRIYGGGGSGGGGGPTQSTVTQTNIPDWLRPQVEMVLGGATQELFNTRRVPGTYDPNTETTSADTYEITGTRPFQPYSQNAADYIAPFSPLQQQAMQGAANLQTPGQFQTGSQLATEAGLGGLGVAQQALGYGGMGLGYGQLGTQYGGLGAGYGQMGAGYGQLGAQFGQRGSQFGSLGAGFGAQAAGMAPEAQRAGASAANIGGLGLDAANTGAQVGMTAAQLAGQQAGTGSAFFRQATDPGSTQALMSPYMQNVVQQQQQDLQRQSDIARQGIGGQFAKAGAFGGGRFAVQQGMAAADLARQKAAVQATGMQNAFADAQRAQQFGSNLGLQGLSAAQQGLGNVLQGGQLGLSGIDRALAGQQARLSSLQQAGQLYGLGMQGAGVGIQGAESGMRGAGVGLQGAQTGIQGAESGMRGAGLGLQGIGTGLQGLGQATGALGLTGQMGGRLGDLGAQQLAAQQGVISTQAGQGATQQQQQQNVINQAIQTYAQSQQAPMERLQQYNALLRGYALPGQTVTQYQAAPPVAGQLAGLGVAAAGATKAFSAKKGGRVPKSGIDRLALRRALAGA